LDEYRPRASARGQCGGRGTFLLPLLPDKELLRRPPLHAGVATRFGDSGFFSKSFFSTRACSRGLDFARHRGARAFFALPADDNGRCRSLRAELRLADLIFPC
jgi:hypothetical protein